IVVDLSKCPTILLSPQLLQKLPVIAININHAGLHEIPDYALQLPGLKSLSVTQNPINKAPERLKNLDNLLTLSISGTKIPKDCPEIQFLRQFKKLKIVN
ncbi:MAG: hypothetical protein JSS12_11650, partial [Verrucomicrobia bacterium]|nr:hypothetical protein [Verrucomicrobiota bacterium]